MFTTDLLVPAAVRSGALTALVAAASLIVLVGCPRNVPQNSNSGKDYRHKGAKKVKIEDGEGRARDIVTYPGGDRVDWKVIELPEGQKGDLDIKLRWRPPRPGGDLAFNVYDQWYHRVEQAKPSRKGKRTKKIKLKQAEGKYYVQVYAPRRSDAGRYTLSVRFRERKPVVLPSVEELAGQIQDPPPLPAVIEPKEKTPEELAAEEAERVRLEEEARVKAEEDAKEQGRLDELRKPVYAKIRRTQEASGGGVIITINAGKNKKIDKSWEGTLLTGRSRTPLPDGDFKIIRVTPRACVAKVRLSMDQVKANPRVVLRRTKFD